MEFLEGGRVVDGVSNSNIVVDDAFCLALNEVGDVDGGGARGADGGEGVEQSSFKESQSSMLTPAARLMLRV